MVITDPNEEHLYGTWAGGFRKLIKVARTTVELSEYVGLWEASASWKRESSPSKGYLGDDPLGDVERDLTEIGDQVRVLSLRHYVVHGEESPDLTIDCSRDGHLMCVIKGADTASRFKLVRRLKHFLGADFTENMVPGFHTPPPPTKEPEFIFLAPDHHPAPTQPDQPGWLKRNEHLAAWLALPAGLLIAFVTLAFSLHWFGL